MNRRLYFKNRILLMSAQAVFLFLCLLYLRTLGITGGQMLVLALPYVLSVCCFHVLDYNKKQKRFRQIYTSLKQMDKKFLFPEVFTGSGTYEEEAWLAIMRSMAGSMAEEVQRLSDQNRSYREYIETWVHEIKQPVCSIQLLCQSPSSDDIRRIRVRAEEINQLTEQVLYYARSDDLSNDLLIHPASLESIILEAIEENRQLLLISGFSIDLQEGFPKIYTDEKALIFVCSQLIRNAAAYRRTDKDSPAPALTISWKMGTDKVCLTIHDNGTGISPEDLPRIFEKGFTGQNGRKNRRSTGMGLYLCRKFCSHMQVDISLTSDNLGTTASLLIPALKES